MQILYAQRVTFCIHYLRWDFQVKSAWHRKLLHQPLAYLVRCSLSKRMEQSNFKDLISYIELSVPVMMFVLRGC